MIDAVNVAAQTVASNAPVVYGSTRICTGCSARHEEGSGRITLLRAGIYKVTFSGNYSTTAAGTAILNIATNGEPVAAAQIQQTTAAATVYSGSVTTLVKVPCPGTVSVSVINASSVPVSITNANLVVTREC